MVSEYTPFTLYETIPISAGVGEIVLAFALLVLTVRLPVREPSISFEHPMNTESIVTSTAMANATNPRLFLILTVLQW
ncbi:hypothetical protein SDC9_140943 [bioreactor metagenome]|uniref:Uncharacterized protein n=1 Tax=bioreactor metagenome TaxID=1076179 RepID=A0A645DWV9_9ZZZZ